MIRAILKFLLYFSVGFAVVYGLQIILFRQQSVTLRYPYLSVDLFFASLSFLICVVFYWLSKRDKFNDQLGYLYLPTLFVKVLLFFLCFRTSVFRMENFTGAEVTNLMMPLFLFLVLEVVLIARILTKKFS